MNEAQVPSAANAAAWGQFIENHTQKDTSTVQDLFPLASPCPSPPARLCGYRLLIPGFSLDLTVMWLPQFNPQHTLLDVVHTHSSFSSVSPDLTGPQPSSGILFCYQPTRLESLLWLHKSPQWEGGFTWERPLTGWSHSYLATVLWHSHTFLVTLFSGDKST